MLLLKMSISALWNKTLVESIQNRWRAATSKTEPKPAWLKSKTTLQYEIEVFTAPRREETSTQPPKSIHVKSAVAGFVCCAGADIFTGGCEGKCDVPPCERGMSGGAVTVMLILWDFFQQSQLYVLRGRKKQKNKTFIYWCESFQPHNNWIRIIKAVNTMFF